MYIYIYIYIYIYQNTNIKGRAGGKMLILLITFSICNRPCLDVSKTYIKSLKHRLQRLVFTVFFLKTEYF